MIFNYLFYLGNEVHLTNQRGVSLIGLSKKFSNSFNWLNKLCSIVAIPWLY